MSTTGIGLNSASFFGSSAAVVILSTGLMIGHTSYSMHNIIIIIIC